MVHTDYTRQKMNNKIIDLETNLEVPPEKCSIRVIFKGNNNTLYLHQSNNYTPYSIIRFYGDNAMVYIEKSTYTIGAKIFASHNSTVFMGENYSCHSETIITASEERHVILGKDCMFSFGCEIKTTDVHGIYDFESGERTNIGRDIVIKNHVWIGQNVYISKGSRIGSGSVIGAYSYVNKTLDNNCIYAGQPTRKIAESKIWTRPGHHNSTRETDYSSFTRNKSNYWYLPKDNDTEIDLVLESLRDGDVISKQKNILLLKDLL